MGRDFKPADLLPNLKGNNYVRRAFERLLPKRCPKLREERWYQPDKYISIFGKILGGNSKQGICFSQHGFDAVNTPRARVHFQFNLGSVEGGLSSDGQVGQRVETFVGILLQAGQAG